ncbi:MAG: hypothetical protein R2798_11385 [Chitinophagales bacterium]|nr:hypothetical protein [Bacteroidota bacterium]MCB9043191.1 hypothetical protein [Chitinophagales bacterium]
MKIKKIIPCLFLLLFFGCNDSIDFYKDIELIETSYISFGILTPIDMYDEGVNSSGSDKVVIVDTCELKEISLLLNNLIPSSEKGDYVRRNVYLKSVIKLKSNKSTVELLTNQQFILLNDEVYKYSKELIDKLRGK